jgi:hypothetical protein
MRDCASKGEEIQEFVIHYIKEDDKRKKKLISVTN